MQQLYNNVFFLYNPSNVATNKEMTQSCQT